MLKEKTNNMKRLLIPFAFCLMALASSAQSASASFSVDKWKGKITQFSIQLLDGKQHRLSGELKDQRYEDLVSIRKGEERVQLKCRDKEDGLKEVVFLAEGKDGGLFIRCTGRFTQKDLDQMTSSLKE